MLEDKSRNTAENAAFTGRWSTQARRALAAGHVGDHMPRSVGAFRKAGFRGRGLSGRLAHARRDRPVPAVGRLRPAGAHRRAIQEWVGLLSWLTGCRATAAVRSLFPGLPGAQLLRKRSKRSSPAAASPAGRRLEVVRVGRLALAVDHNASVERQPDRRAPHLRHQHMPFGPDERARRIGRADGLSRLVRRAAGGSRLRCRRACGHENFLIRADTGRHGTRAYHAWGHGPMSRTGGLGCCVNMRSKRQAGRRRCGRVWMFDGLGARVPRSSCAVLSSRGDHPADLF